MAKFVITDAGVLLGQHVLTDVAGEYDVDGKTEMVERRWAAGGGFKHFLPGLNEFETMIKGHAAYGTAEIGQQLSPANRGEQYALSIIPQNNSASTYGDTAIIHRGLLQSLKMPTGNVGEMAGFELGMKSDLVQTVGYVGAPLASRTTAGLTGTAVALTGPTATQKLYAALHVTAAAGTNLAVKVQSDNGVGFGTPTDRITFTTVSAVGWQFLSVAGDLSSETHWRVTATIASSTFTFGVYFGVA